MHCNTLKQDNDSTVRGDGGSRVGEVRAGTTSPMPEHKGFKPQQLSRDPLTPADGPGSVSVILLPSANEASHPGLMKQFELYAIIIPTYTINIAHDGRHGFNN